MSVNGKRILCDRSRYNKSFALFAEGFTSGGGGVRGGVLYLSIMLT